MKVTIIGAGNIGTYLAAYISLKKNYKVWVHTLKPSSFNKEITLLEEEKNFVHHAKVHCITSNIKDAVNNADYIFITHPSFINPSTMNEIASHVKKGAIVGSIPSFGSKEYYIDDLISKGCVFWGSQRVPSITRLIAYGKSIVLKQKNPFIRIGVIPQEYTDKVCSEMTTLIDIPCIPFNNNFYGSETSYTSTVYPSKIYELFSNNSDNMVYKKIPIFYEEWGDDSSSILLQLNQELKEIFLQLNHAINFNKSILEKLIRIYNLQTPEELTQKFKTSPNFTNLFSSEVELKNSHSYHMNSQSFIEDLASSLCILKSFAEILDIKVQILDMAIYWSQELLQKDYLINGNLCGSDISSLVTPQTKGIFSKEDFISSCKAL